MLVYDDDDNLKVLIERKTPSNLMSSIKDDRYSEQSRKLNDHPLHNITLFIQLKGIVFLIEMVMP